MRLYFFSLFIFCLCHPIVTSAQVASISQYPQHYFRNPLSIPISLAGNFGECRPGHFHSGIDIKTKGQENFAVHAAADGYISRIKIEKSGFGHALYLTHPNGFTTVYAHLNNFIAPVQRFLRKTQYEKEQWSVDLTLSPEQFPVKKGQQIAWSGNTGGSTAPHLHFEIRDTKTEHPLNPLLFGLPVTDTRAPAPTQIALYDARQSIYEQKAEIYSLKQSAGSYVLTDTVIVNSSQMGMGVEVNDFMNGSHNTLNFYTARWFLDGAPQGEIRLDDIGYDVTRYLHGYVDYKVRKETGKWFQLLFQLPGNHLDQIYYGLNALRGVFSLNDNAAHKVSVEIKDAFGNEADINFFVKAGSPKEPVPCILPFNANARNSFDTPNVQFMLAKQDLYDDICFTYKESPDEQSYSKRHQIHYPYVPVHTWFLLKIKADKPVPFHLRDKIAFMYSDGKSQSGTAATFFNGFYQAKVRSFGNYWLKADTIAPVIRPLENEHADLRNAKKISISVKEETTSVKSFRAELDGKWLLFEPRGDLFIYEIDQHCPPGEHTLKIITSDESDNTRTHYFHFKR